jgi:hypothetical protein
VLNETIGKVYIGKHLTDTLRIQNGQNLKML